MVSKRRAGAFGDYETAYYLHCVVEGCSHTVAHPKFKTALSDLVGHCKDEHVWDTDDEKWADKS